ncbi:CbiX/SirB N-terminal domain-containing protein [Modicisalibacter coralii]|uniref:sirohydrochlorin chelatase n=1 Tax=Modicisalibacter coralii TaxID=2304602 RepID=UPI002D784D93|nr:CbiX/SirB N-terminal domain-containing protein [Halomonas coralii]
MRMPPPCSLRYRVIQTLYVFDSLDAAMRPCPASRCPTTDKARDAVKETLMNDALILLAHGSRDPRWRAPFDNLAAALAERLERPLRLAYMELCEPSLESVAAELDAAGCRRAEVLPLFFAAGRHLREDVPGQIAALHGQHPSLALELLAPVGEHPAFVDALAGIIEGRAVTETGVS